MVTQLTNKAYPIKTGDIVIACRICGKQVVLQPLGNHVWEVLYHNTPQGVSCNGTGAKARLVNIQHLKVT